MSDYLPRTDGDFNAWQVNFLTYANANLAALGLVAADLLPVSNAQTNWNTAYNTHVTAQAAAIAATTSKDNARGLCESAIRPLVRRLQASPVVSDQEKAALGITVPDTNRTPVQTPDTRPVAQVDTAQRLRHTITYTDEGTPSKRSRPKGCIGAEVWCAFTSPGQPIPTDPSAFTFVGLDTRTPFTVEYGGDNGGKQANYILRWINSRGEKGPWSETYSATIAA